MNLRIMNIKPLISEKSAFQSETSNVFTFRVPIDLRKPEIKSAIEKVFKVDVLSVRTSILHGEWRRARNGRMIKSSNSKKAFVVLKAGQKIDVFGGVVS